METVSVAEARKSLADLMAKVAYSGERVTVERNGKPMMVWIGVEELDRLETEVTKAKDALAFALADTARAMIRAERGGVPLPDSADLINELREERDREIGEAVFGC